MQATALSRRRHRIVIVLLTDRVGLGQGLVALGLQSRGLGGGRRTVIGGLIKSRIDLVELLPFLDVAPLDEHPLQNDAVHLGPDLGDFVGHRSPG